MTIAADIQLGPYEILSALGAGGMGEAYRARQHSLATQPKPQGIQDFLGLWKDADADFPILIEAKKEYERLN